MEQVNDMALVIGASKKENCASACCLSVRELQFEDVLVLQHQCVGTVDANFNVFGPNGEHLMVI